MLLPVLLSTRLFLLATTDVAAENAVWSFMAVQEVDASAVATAVASDAYCQYTCQYAAASAVFSTPFASTTTAVATENSCG